MNPDTVYAVIDLETTGADVKGGDRIIQFGCALIKNGRIIQTISQLINPDMPIPPAIQHLTNLSPSMLVTAPYFDEVAQSFANLLEDTVIVAHNVNFDYPFLSKEFVRCGQNPLTNAAIDTVQLAQIILPTQQSYRLADLTHYLKIEHNNPHRADSDAISTAKLFVRLCRIFKKLPGPTQHTIAERADFLVRETGQLLVDMTTKARRLDKGHLVIRSLVVRTPKTVIPDQVTSVYPELDKDKRRLFKSADLRFRFAQSKMMNAIHDNATGSQEPLFIEAGTGLGKSLGYMLPYSYLATAAKKLIVATSTTILQEQLAVETGTQLAAITGQTPSIAVLKSPRHFIDLNKFATTLAVTDLNRATKLVQLRILVWLTQTKTGDLDELHLTTSQAPFLAEIRHTGDCGTKYSNPYFDVDFYGRVTTAAQAAAIIVTNHAFLINHHDDAVFENEPYLVVDEAQHFPDSATKGFTVALNLNRLRHLLQNLQQIIRKQDAPSLETIYAKDQLLQYQLHSMFTAGGTTLNTVEKMQSQLFHHFFSRHERPQTGGFDHVLTAEEVVAFIDRFEPDARAIGNNLQQILQIAATIRTDYIQHEKRFVASDVRIFQQLDEVSARLREQISAVNAVADRAPELLSTEMTVSVVKVRHPDDLTSLNVRWLALNVRPQVQKLLAQFTAPVFTGATLTVMKQATFLTDALGYPPMAKENVLTFRSPFKYRQLARIMIAKDAPTPPGVMDAEYLDYLCAAIAQVGAIKKQTLVLFNSLETIRAVYNRLSQTPLASETEIMAQGVTGSTAKIARRFAVSTAGILLGAASFFEGIDYPNKQLECVILTRLPFDSPTDTVVAARHAAITAAGADPFRTDTLPRAILRVRQAFGRLIRREDDRGVFVILDPRFTKTQYGRSIQKALPNVDSDWLPAADMAPLITDWLEEVPSTPAPKKRS